MTKCCSKCEKEKDTAEFRKSRAKKGGVYGRCKECRRAYGAAWYRLNPIKVAAWAKCDPVKKAANRRKTEYGITTKQYEDLLITQKGACAICKEPCKTGRRLAVDHDHSSGKIRGLLCSLCNRTLGGFKDSIEKLTAAISYLTVNQMNESKSAVDKTVDSPHSK